MNLPKRHLLCNNFFIFLFFFSFHQSINALDPKTLAQNFTLDQKKALIDLKEMALLPHPFGSKRQLELASFIQKDLEKIHLSPSLQPFSVTAPLGKKETQTIHGQNIFVKINLTKQAACMVLIGSHYDSKADLIAKKILLGANDSGSSSVLLLQLAAYFNKVKNLLPSKCDVGFVWFDGEESVLEQWFDSERTHPSKIKDHTYGSRFFVDQLTPCQGKFLCKKDDSARITHFILLDMIGSPDVSLVKESFSNQELWQLTKKAAVDLDVTEVLFPKEDAFPIEDDHVPFKEKNIPVLNLIDFHHLDHWHKETDRINQIDMKSLDKVGKIAVYLISSL